jgi:hypothetical protein
LSVKKWDRFSQKKIPTEDCCGQVINLIKLSGRVIIQYFVLEKTGYGFLFLLTTKKIKTNYKVNQFFGRHYFSVTNSVSLFVDEQFKHFQKI